VEFYGQIIAAVIATTEDIAKRAAELVDVTYQPLPCITTIQVFNVIVLTDSYSILVSIRCYFFI
jgi:xanthine dehydrogenase molybdopterin-binding subunit B